MDNLAHTLFALALARWRPLARSKLAVPALVVSASFPDVDTVTHLAGGPAAYLAHHRGITHSFVGLAVEWMILTYGFLLLERRASAAARRRAGGSPDSKSASWKAIGAAVFAGLASHLLLDSLISYGIRPWLPFSGRWYYGDLVFVVDPWLWLLFGALAALPGAATRAGDRGWLFIAMVASAIVLGAPSEQSGLAIKVAWLPLLATLAVLRVRRVGERRPRAVVIPLLVLLGVYFGAIIVAKLDAAARGREFLATELASTPGAALRRHALLPIPTRPWQWMFVAETDSELLWIDVTSFGSSRIVSRAPRGSTVPELPRAAATWDGRAWASFVRFPWVRVEREGNRTVVLLSDARYWYTDFCTVSVVLDP